MALNLRKIGSTPPRALEVASRDDGQTFVGRDEISGPEMRRRSERLAAEVAAGRIPLDETSSPMVARAMMREHRRGTRGRGGKRA